MAYITLDNLGTVNKNIVTIGTLDLWFSYSTIVAFDHPLTGFICSKNRWSMTTGKLLNELCPNKKERLDADAFDKQLEELLHKLHLSYMREVPAEATV